MVNAAAAPPSEAVSRVTRPLPDGSLTIVARGIMDVGPSGKAGAGVALVQMD